MQIGAQLYTVREYTKTPEDFAATLEKIADIGYKVVQVSGTCAFEPEWLKEQLARTGLICALTHTNQDRLAKETDITVKEHAVFGCKYIGIGIMNRPYDDYMQNYLLFKDTFLPVAVRLKELGAKFMYHNHNMEFARTGSGRENYLERMKADFPPDTLSFILDTYWVQAAGGDSVEWINKLKGQLQCVHLKDMAYENGSARMAPVYEGNMNFDAILKACENAGTEYLLVEQDDCYGKNPFDCLRLSYRNLKAKGLD